MFGRIFAGGACATLALIVIAGPARAEGTANVRQSDGSTENYVHVHLRLSGQTLWVRSDDRQSTLEVRGAACSSTGLIERCLASATKLHSDGRAEPISLNHGTLYVNLTGDAQALSHTSQQLGPHQVLVLLNTARGTIVAVKGTLDRSK